MNNLSKKHKLELILELILIKYYKKNLDLTSEKLMILSIKNDNILEKLFELNQELGEKEQIM